jgi:hypothetical protein
MFICPQPWQQKIGVVGIVGSHQYWVLLDPADLHSHSFDELPVKSTNSVILQMSCCQRYLPQESQLCEGLWKNKRRAMVQKDLGLSLPQAVLLMQVPWFHNLHLDINSCQQLKHSASSEIQFFASHWDSTVVFLPHLSVEDGTWIFSQFPVSHLLREAGLWATPLLSLHLYLSEINLYLWKKVFRIFFFLVEECRAQKRHSSSFSFFFFLQNWGLNSGPHNC